MSRRRKGDVDWIVGHWSEAAATVAITTQTVLPLINAADLDEHDDDVTVVRIVGQVFFYWATSESPPAPNTFIHERIRLGTENLESSGYQTSGRASFTSVADEAFLWHRVSYQNNIEGAFAEQAHPWYNVINVKVQRRIKPGQALLYSIENTSGSLDLRYFVFLRCLVRF